MPRGRKATSDIWSHFKKTDSQRAVCLLCNKSVASGVRPILMFHWCAHFYLANNQPLDPLGEESRLCQSSTTSKPKSQDLEHVASNERQESEPERGN
jgi:hypothetical protein